MMKKYRVYRFWTVALCFIFYASVGLAQDLSTSAEWLALGHYRPSFFGGVKSTIDSDNFFLAKDGKINPHSELQATIDLFQGNDTKKQCFFPARYSFLKKQGLIKTDFPSCPDYESFKKDLRTSGITLIYTDAYMNNPASLFGHTLMRIDVPEEKTQLMAHGMNYGAMVPPDTNGALFAILGLTGGYFGSFTVKPYYNVINTYNNIENRDIWEFQLNLTRLEQERFIAHLWEVGQTQTRYFFFSENCSYMLLEVLDAVQPKWRLADDFPAQAIPLDTLKAINKRSDLIGKINYRPSRQKRIEERYKNLNKKQKKALSEFLETEGKINNALTKQEQADVLETAYEYTQYQWEADKIALTDYRRKTFRLLNERQTLNMTTSEPVVQKSSPFTAHDSKRLGLALGWWRGQRFQEIAFRPAYHSLADRPEGLRSGSEINFLNTEFRYYDKKRKLVLQRLGLGNIYSVAPWTKLFQPISYQVRVDIRRVWNPKTDKEGYVGHLSGGSGITVELFPEILAYGFVKTAVQHGGIMPHNVGLSVGSEIGVLGYFPNTQIQVGAERLFSDNRLMNQTNFKSEIVYNLGKNRSVYFNYDWEKIKQCSENTIRFGMRFFF